MKSTDRMSNRNGDEPPKLLLLYGALRSGTTLVRIILDGHPDIYCPGERDFMLDHLHRDGDGFRLNREGLEMNRIFQASGLEMPDTDDGREAFFDMLRQQDPGPGKTFLLVVHRKLDLLFELAPDIQVIHLLRDPRDVARSSIGMGWAGNTFYGVEHWIHTEEAWQATTTQLAPEQVLEMRYEDMVNEPKLWMSKMCEHAGYQYDAAMLSFPERSTYTDIDPSLSFQWKRKQTPKEIGLVEWQVGDFLADCGYEPSGHPVAAPNSFEKLQLFLQNKIAVWRTIFSRYGVFDPVYVRIAKKIGQPALARQSQLRINEKHKEYLK